MAGCVAVLCFLSAHIWKMEFSGNSYYTDERLENICPKRKISESVHGKKDAVNPVLEENLRLTFPDISWVSVRKEGTSLIVALEEMVKYDAASGEKIKTEVHMRR